MFGIIINKKELNKIKLEKIKSDLRESLHTIFTRIEKVYIHIHSPTDLKGDVTKSEFRDIS